MSYGMLLCYLHLIDYLLNIRRNIKKINKKKFLLAKYLLLGSSIAILKLTTSRPTYKYSHVYYPKENNS